MGWLKVLEVGMANSGSIIGSIIVITERPSTESNCPLNVNRSRGLLTVYRGTNGPARATIRLDSF